jgi:hypothetical protein
MPETMLVNYWYAHPVGHCIEALRYCLGYKAADRDLSVSVLLNEATPVELARCCSFINSVYPVPYTTFEQPDGDPRAALATVPPTWDWVVDNHRELQSSHDAFAGFRRFYDAAGEYFQARRGHNWTGGEPPPYLPHQQLRLELPAAARRRAHETLGGRRAISVLLAGHSDPRAFYPSVASWQLILGEIAERFPDVVFCLIGKLGSGSARSTSTITRAEVERLLRSLPASDCFDRPLLEQLAIVEASALYVSPHSGFGFAAVSVGTPWLAISGGQWHEPFFNGVPFYSVIPDTKRYPCFGWGAPLPIVAADEDGEGPRTVSMSAARIRDDLPEIVHAAELLLDGRLDYEQALRQYFPRLLAAYDGDRSRVFSFDGIDSAYI